MIRAALIDLDGTLVDSAPELARAVDRVLADLGHPPAGVARARHWVGEGIDRLLEQALEWASGKAPGEDGLRSARIAFDTAYAEIIGTNAPIYPGVVAGLERLRAAGIACACITNKARVFAIGLVGAIGIAERFDVIVAGDTVAERKPAAAPLEAAARKLGVAVTDCVVVGDSAIDVAAARAAGCPAWCVRTGYSRGAPIDSAAPDRVFDRLDALAEALCAEVAGA